jgi:hypothetical protein
MHLSDTTQQTKVAVEGFAERLSASSDAIMRAIDNDALNEFEALVEERMRMLQELAPLVRNLARQPEGADLAKLLLAEASKAESRMLDLMYQNLEALRSELAQVDEAQTNLNRIAESYGLN